MNLEPCDSRACTGNFALQKLIGLLSRDGWIEGWMEGGMDGWMDGWKGGWMEGEREGGREGRVGEWREGWMDGGREGGREGEREGEKKKNTGRMNIHRNCAHPLFWARGVIYNCLHL